MKAKILLISLISFIFLNNKTYSQGEAAVPVLLLQSSPSHSAMGATGIAIPTEDPFGFVFNPAQLGYTSQKNNLSFIFYPSKIDWLGFGEFEVKGRALNAGYNFKNLIGFPISFGFGYSNTEVDFGTYIRTDEMGNVIGTSDPKDYYYSYSLGFDIDYFVQLSAGITYKKVTSDFRDFPIGLESSGISTKTNVIDFGILLNIPVLKLIDEQIQLKLDENFMFRPDFNFSLGYSKSNIGDSIYYIDPAQADPLPRMDRIGYGTSTGFDLITDDFRLNAFNLSFTVEADDILIERDSEGWSYQPTLSDLKF